MNNSYKDFFEKVLSRADIAINGERPWDLTVHNPHLYRRVFLERTLGLGEAYMDGWWDAKELDQFFYKLLRGVEIDEEVPFDWRTLGLALKSSLLNMQTKKRSHTVAEKHYDLGNEFYEKMLDKRMVYSCAYWKDAANLDEAQEQKLDLICKKIYLKPGEKVLDIGCGWGGFARYAAERYGCEVTAVNISKEQLHYARESCKGLPVSFLETDYRNITGTFDKIVSVGMFEHVGYKNYFHENRS